MFPLAEIVRRRRKPILPIFVRPSFERHEVTRAATIMRLMSRRVRPRGNEADRDPQRPCLLRQRSSAAVGVGTGNLPIARGLRGLIYVVWDLSEVDPSFVILLAGDGRMRIGFGEIDPPDGGDRRTIRSARPCIAAGRTRIAPSPDRLAHRLSASRGSGRTSPTRKIRSGIAGLALGSAPGARYNPLYARAGPDAQTLGDHSALHGIHGPTRSAPVGVDAQAVP